MEFNDGHEDGHADETVDQVRSFERKTTFGCFCIFQVAVEHTRQKASLAHVWITLEHLLNYGGYEVTLLLLLP